MLYRFEERPLREPLAIMEADVCSSDCGGGVVSVELMPPRKSDEPEAAGEVVELSLCISLAESGGVSGLRVRETSTDAASRSWTC